MGNSSFPNNRHKKPSTKIRLPWAFFLRGKMKFGAKLWMKNVQNNYFNVFFQIMLKYAM